MKIKTDCSISFVLRNMSHRIINSSNNFIMKYAMNLNENHGYVLYHKYLLSIPAHGDLAHQNSNITQRVKMVHFEEVTYAETGDEFTDLPRLRYSADGFMDNAPTLRNTFGADLVVLLTETMGGCGLAYTQSTTPISGFTPNAFAFVRRSCAADNLSFPYEMGHNIGAKHDCVASPNNDINYGIFTAKSKIKPYIKNYLNKPLDKEMHMGILEE